MKPEITLLTLDTTVKTFAEAHDDLREAVQTLNAAIDDLKRRHLPIIKKHVARTAEARETLKADIESAPHIFIKPRTIVIRGVKLGFEKAKGKLTYEDADQVVKLIRKHFDEDQSALLIRTKEEPNKTALSELAASELKRLGCTITETGDQVIIKPTDNGVEKLVSQLLKDACENTEAS